MYEVYGSTDMKLIFFVKNYRKKRINENGLKTPVLEYGESFSFLHSTILIQQKCPTVSKHLFLQIAVRLFNIYYN
jgi:hypothetical protein